MATKEEVFKFAREEAARQGVSPDLIEAMVRQESQGNISAKSKKGARGPMQLMPGTAKEMGVNINDWKDNVRGGVKYVNQLLTRFEDPALAVAAYNAGPTAVRRAGGIPEFKETQDYVQKVLGGTMSRRTVTEEELGLASAQLGTQPRQAGGRNVVSVEELSPETQAAPRQRTIGENIRGYGREAGRQAGLTGRYALEGIGQVLDIGGAPVANMMRMAGIQANTPSQSMSQLATSLGLPQPQNPLEESFGNIARAGFGVAPNVAAGRILSGSAQPGGAFQNLRNLATGQTTVAAPARTTTQQVGQAVAQSPGAQVAGVAAGTGAAEIARQQADVQNPFALAAINLAAGVPAAAVVSRAGNVRTGQQFANPEAGQLIESGRARGVNLSAADVKGGSGTLRTLRNIAGTAQEVNQKRAGELEQLINRTAEKLKPESVKDGNEARVVAQDLRTQYKAAKDAVSPKFNRAQELAGNSKITLDRSAQASNEVGDFFPVTAETNVLKRNLDKLEKYVSSGGGTYKEIRDLQKMIGSELDRVKRGVPTGAFSEAQKNALSRLYGSLSDDVDAWAAPRSVNNKPVYTPAGAAHTQAMEQFRQTVVPFRDDDDIYRLVSSRVTGSDYDKAAEVFNNKIVTNTATADLATNLMSDTGRRAAQYSIINDARLSAFKQDPTNPSIPGFVGKLNVGITDNPTPHRVILGKTPGLIEELSTVRDIANAAAPQQITNADAIVPYAGRLGTGIASGVGVSALGLDPMSAGAVGISAGLLAPRIAGRAADFLESDVATRYLLGQSAPPSTGLRLSAGQAQMAPLANMPTEQSLSPAYNLLDYIGRTFNNE
jgi:hypothetical protein